jgi:methylglyoxal synthase
MKYVAIIAHDAKKMVAVELAKKFETALENIPVVCTGTTGSRIQEATGLKLVTRVLSGPLGGDAQIGALVATNEVSLVIFLTDPLTAHPHEPDVQSLMRLCNVHNIPLALNEATAVICLQNIRSIINA